MSGTARKSQVETGGVLARTRLKKAGGSLVVTMPAAARNLLHLHEGQELAISVEGSRVVMEPVSEPSPVRVRRPKYTLDELLAATADAPLTDDERDWQDAPAAGRETW